MNFATQLEKLPNYCVVDIEIICSERAKRDLQEASQLGLFTIEASVLFQLNGNHGGYRTVRVTLLPCAFKDRAINGISPHIRRIDVIFPEATTSERSQ